jgi:hypothetical protein
MKTTTTILLAGAMTLLSQFASAQGMGMGPPNFSAMDSDSNGELSVEELAALPFVQAGNVQVDQILTQWDTDDSGTVSEEEFNNRPAMGMGGMG